MRLRGFFSLQLAPGGGHTFELLGFQLLDEIRGCVSGHSVLRAGYRNAGNWRAVLVAR